MGLAIGDYEILPDGENAVVMKVGMNKKTGAKTLTPNAYVRGVFEALEVVQRRMGVEAFAKHTSAAKILAELKAQHNELLMVVKKNQLSCQQNYQIF